MPIEVPNRTEWFPNIDAFPRPDWPAIRAWERAWVPKDERQRAKVQTVGHWLERLQQRLGGAYSVAESEHFHLVSELSEDVRTRLLQFLETARYRSTQTLGDVAWTDGIGKHVVLRFTDQQDYYAYISHYYEAGEHATSGGVCLRKDYVHIASYEALEMAFERKTLAHELAHNLLGHLPLPAWLNEALALAFEMDLTGGRFAAVDRELQAEHDAYWNRDTIQEFWRGRSFHTVEGQRVSYNLAEILLEIINREIRPPAEVFRRFVKQSRWQDAGEAASIEQLEASLGEIASVFLGEGDWAPRPSTWHSSANAWATK